MNRLVVFPGLSSPHSEKYRSTYELLRRECGKRNVSFELVCYPGQVDEYGKIRGVLSPSTTQHHVVKLLKELDRKGEDFRILAISSGCVDALSALLNADKLRCCDRVIAWGPIPHWQHWVGAGTGQYYPGLGCGSRLIDSASDFYSEIVPFEYIAQKLEMPLTIGIGANDRFSTPGFISYLQDLCKDNLRFGRVFSYIDGCGHNVSEEDTNWVGYIDLVFAETGA